MNFMKKRKKRISTLALLLAALTLLPAALPACAPGIADPIGDEETEEWAPLLTAEEAEAIFGKVTGLDVSCFDGRYLYYETRLYDNPDKDDLTVYCYDIETGEAKPVCQDSVCTHKPGSGCRFADYFEGGGPPRAYNGGVLYTTLDRETTSTTYTWYSPDTGEERVITPADGENCFPTEQYLYYSTVEILEDPEYLGQAQRKLWRYDWESGSSTMVASGDPDDLSCDFRPFTVDGEEVIYAWKGTVIEEDGELKYGVQLYRVDETTGEFTLTCDKVFYRYRMVYAKTVVYQEDDPEDPERPIYRFVDLETGEEITIQREQVGREIVSDTGILFWGESRKKESAQIEFYTFADGKTQVYPLQGDPAWDGLVMQYIRGRFYLITAWKYDEDGNVIDTADLIEWDLLTGKQRIVKGEEVIVT